MEKLAAKRSPDPKQQHLRDRKKTWNKAVSEVINRIIEMKSAINGRGSADYGLPVSNIKSPLPTEIVGFLSELSGAYAAIATEAHNIIQEQEVYSQTRRKPGQRPPAGQPAPTPASEPAKVATASAKRGRVIIKNIELPTELAISAEEQEYGLMEKKWPPPIMSFVYSSPQNARFWMHRTPSPLSIIFSLNGTITNICKGEPYSTKLIGQENELSDLVVEVPYGMCEKLGINIGNSIKLIM